VIDPKRIVQAITVQWPALTTSPRSKKQREISEENQNTSSTTHVVLCGQGEALRGTLGPTTAWIQQTLWYQVQRKKPDLTSTCTVISMWRRRIPHTNPLSIFTESLRTVYQPPPPQRMLEVNQNISIPGADTKQLASRMWLVYVTGTARAKYL